MSAGRTGAIAGKPRSYRYGTALVGTRLARDEAISFDIVLKQKTLAKPTADMRHYCLH
jgi:hypothetical protein